MNVLQQRNGCNAAYRTEEFHGWGCDVTGGACAFLRPDAEAYARKYGEGPLSDDTFETEDAT